MIIIHLLLCKKYLCSQICVTSFGRQTQFSPKLVCYASLRCMKKNSFRASTCEEMPMSAIIKGHRLYAGRTQWYGKSVCTSEPLKYFDQHKKHWTVGVAPWPHSDAFNRYCKPKFTLQNQLSRTHLFVTI